MIRWGSFFSLNTHDATFMSFSVHVPRIKCYNHQSNTQTRSPVLSTDRMIVEQGHFCHFIGIVFKVSERICGQSSNISFHHYGNSPPSYPRDFFVISFVLKQCLYQLLCGDEGNRLFLYAKLRTTLPFFDLNFLILPFDF